MDTTHSRLEKAARRQVSSGIRSGYLLLSMATVLGSAAYGQVAAPRYQSPLEAPKPQLNIPAAPAATTPNGTMVEYQIVRVNDQIINNSDYERAARQLVAEAQQASVGPAELEQRQKDMLRDMIDQQLLLSRGKELDINADSEVIRRLDEIRKQNHLDSLEALEKAVHDSGISYEDFKANIKNSVITQQVVRDEVGRNIRLSAKEEQTYYDEHKQDFAKPEQVRLSEILIPTPEDATEAQITQAQTKADMVASKLKAGGNFDDLAKQYSGGPNPETGGDLGTFKRGDLAKVLEDQTFPLNAGETTAPIRTRQGFVLLKVTDHIPAGIQPLSAVEEQVQEALYSKAIQPALRAYLTKLRENAYIDVAPGYVDTGASPKETKPVFAGATPLPVKKKKVEQKARLDRSHPAATPASPASSAAAASTATAGTVPAAAAGSSPQTVATSLPKKRKKIKREKIRYGQAPRNSLPSAPEETLVAGADQGAGGAPVAGPAATTAEQPAEVAESVDEAVPAAPERKKTRFSARAATEAKTKAAAKVAKAKQKAAATPAPLTEEEIAKQKAQTAALGLSGDTAAKKKPKKVKGEKKERIQNKPPAPPAPKPEATPIPPKSVRDKGEPAVTPAPSNPPATPPAPGAPVDTQPSTPSNPAPTPPPASTTPQ